MVLLPSAKHQVLLPETVKLTASIAGFNNNNNLLNSYDLIKDKPFITVSGDGSLIFVPTAYIPSTGTGTNNAIEAAYFTITAPQGVSATNVGVYVLNTNSSSSNISFCGNAVVQTSNSQNVNQMVLDLGKLVSACSQAGVNISNPGQLQAGISLLFTVGGSDGSSPLNVAADGYSLFNYGGSYYIKRLATEVISGNPSVGVVGSIENSYAH